VTAAGNEARLSPYILIVVILVVAVAFYGLSRVSSATAREITIPIGGEPSLDEVKTALERMGLRGGETWARRPGRSQVRMGDALGRPSALS